MAEDGGKQTLGIRARAGEFVRMADTGRLDLDQDLAGAWSFEIDHGDLERLAGRVSNGSFRFHEIKYSSCGCPRVGALKPKIATGRGVRGRDVPDLITHAKP